MQKFLAILDRTIRNVRRRHKLKVCRHPDIQQLLRFQRHHRPDQQSPSKLVPVLQHMFLLHTHHRHLKYLHHRRRQHRLRRMLQK
jgi:hypothetical protein